MNLLKKTILTLGIGVALSLATQAEELTLFVNGHKVHATSVTHDGIPHYPVDMLSRLTQTPAYEMADKTIRLGDSSIKFHPHMLKGRPFLPIESFALATNSHVERDEARDMILYRSNSMASSHSNSNPSFPGSSSSLSPIGDNMNSAPGNSQDIHANCIPASQSNNLPANSQQYHPSASASNVPNSNANSSQGRPVPGAINATSAAPHPNAGVPGATPGNAPALPSVAPSVGQEAISALSTGASAAMQYATEMQKLEMQAANQHALLNNTIQTMNQFTPGNHPFFSDMHMPITPWGTQMQGLNNNVYMNIDPSSILMNPGLDIPQLDYNNIQIPFSPY